MRAARLLQGRGPICRAIKPGPSCTSTITRSMVELPTMMVFDREGKNRQRARAAKDPHCEQYDYLRKEVAKRLIDRLEDIKKEFPLALEVGSYRSYVFQELNSMQGFEGRGGLGNVEKLIQCDVIEDDGLVAPKKDKDDYVKVFKVIADEEHLPFASDTFDLAISNLSLHWVNDLPEAMREIQRVLKPDGAFIASMLGGTSLNELRTSLQLAEQEREGGVSPHVSPAAHVADCGALLQAAGFNLPTVDVDTITVHYPDAITVMEHLQGMGESNANLTRRPHVSRDTFIAAASIYQELYGEPDGSVPVTFQVIYMIGWSPSDTQPKPKPRGSAKASLKDLGKSSQT